MTVRDAPVSRDDVGMPQEDVEVVVAHRQRATLRVGDVFLKVDGDPAHAAIEIEGMRLAPIPTPDVLWHEPPCWPSPP